MLPGYKAVATACSSDKPCCPGKADGQIILELLAKTPELKEALAPYTATPVLAQECGAALLAQMFKDLPVDAKEMALADKVEGIEDKITDSLKAKATHFKPSACACPSKVAGRAYLADAAQLSAQQTTMLTYDMGVAFLAATMKDILKMPEYKDLAKIAVEKEDWKTLIPPKVQMELNDSAARTIAEGLEGAGSKKTRKSSING